MIILETNEERKALQGILNYIWETHTCVWSSDEDVDYDKAEYTNYKELRKHLERFGVATGEGFDLSALLYKLNGDK